MISFDFIMLSILIPTYNYPTLALAESLEQQALKLGITFELICVDDGSFGSINEENQKINILTNSIFIENKTNLGRQANRTFLAKKAQYDWLLFLDADTKPVDASFLKTYTSALESDIDVVFGGIAYTKTPPEKSHFLRWHYGHKRESKSLENRLTQPYLSIILGCFMIRKELYLDISHHIPQLQYGLDVLFTSYLKEKTVTVKHIDAPVYHLGLDENTAFIEKSKIALDTLYYIYNTKNLPNTYSPILKTYHTLRIMGVSKLVGNIIGKYSKRIEQNLKSRSPNLFWFDIYRLGYLCRLTN